MSKVSIARALEVLAESGIALTPKQQDALAEFKSAAMHDDALKVFQSKTATEEIAESWVEKSFNLAEDMSDCFASKVVGRGRGEVSERVFRVETPYGSLKVSLTNETES